MELWNLGYLVAKLVSWANMSDEYRQVTVGTILAWIILSKLVAAVLYVIFTLLKLIFETIKRMRNKSAKLSNEGDAQPVEIIAPDKGLEGAGSFKIDIPHDSPSYKEHVGTMENRPAQTISPNFEIKASLRPNTSVALPKPRTLKQTPKNQVGPSNHRYRPPTSSHKENKEV